MCMKVGMRGTGLKTKQKKKGGGVGENDKGRRGEDEISETGLGKSKNCVIPFLNASYRLLLIVTSLVLPPPPGGR